MACIAEHDSVEILLFDDSLLEELARMKEKNIAPIMRNHAPLEQLLDAPIRNGLNKPSRIRGVGVKMISMGELFSHDRISGTPMERVPVTDKELVSSAVKPDDLLFVRRSLVLDGAGKCSIVADVDESMVFESHLIRVRINSNKALPEFIY